MELWTREIQTNEQGKILMDQFMLDEDYNVPEAKRDVRRIVGSEAKTVIENVSWVENYVKVMGKIEFHVLYVGEGLEPVLSILEGKIPFEEMVYAEKSEGIYDVKMARVDLQCSMINSRKLRMKAIVEIELEEQKEGRASIPLDVESSEKLYKKKVKKDILTLYAKRKDTYRIKEEILLSGTKEAIGTVLWTDIQNRKLNTKLEMDEFALTGELQIFCFYESPDGKIDWIEQTVPYQGRIECNGVEPTMYHQVQADLEDVYIDVRMDEDGEMRAIGIEGTLKLAIAIYDEVELEILEDLYSLEKFCKIETKAVTCERVVLQNHSKCKVLQKLSLPELRGNVLQICHSSGKIQVDEVKLVDEGFLAEGALHISILYVKANDEVPFDTWQGVVPFSYLIECKGITESVQKHITSILEQLSITLIGGDEVEVKAVLAFHCFIRERKEINMIKSVQLEPMKKEEMNRVPGVIGYIVKDGDDLWSLAKKYCTTKEGIMEVNEMADENVKVGERILIFRENMGIL